MLRCMKKYACQYMNVIHARLTDLGAKIEGGGPQRLDEFLRAEAAKWGAVIKLTGATGR